jgi:hypothetical protein
VHGEAPPVPSPTPDPPDEQASPPTIIITNSERRGIP